MSPRRCFDAITSYAPPYALRVMIVICARVGARVRVQERGRERAGRIQNTTQWKQACNREGGGLRKVGKRQSTRNTALAVLSTHPLNQYSTKRCARNRAAAAGTETRLVGARQAPDLWDGAFSVCVEELCAVADNPTVLLQCGREEAQRTREEAW